MTDICIDCSHNVDVDICSDCKQYLHFDCGMYCDGCYNHKCIGCYGEVDSHGHELTSCLTCTEEQY